MGKILETVQKFDDCQRALLLRYVGEDVNDIFETSPDHGEEKDFKESCEALTQYFTTRKNVSFEVFKFRNMTQHDGETIDEFHTRLQMGAKYCEFGENQQREIKSQIELGTSNKKLRRYSFRNPSISLDDLLTYARTFDETERQARGIEGAKGETSAQYEVRKIDFRQKQLPATQRSKERRNPRQPNSKVNVPKMCFRCGDNWPHPNNLCPAMNQKCKRCLKMNHFARVCRSGRRNPTNSQQQGIHNINPQSQTDPPPTESDPDSEPNIFAVSHTYNTKSTKHQSKNTVKTNFHANVSLGKSNVTFLIDSGSSSNIIDESTFKRVQKKNSNIQLTRSKRCLFAFGSPTPLSVIGEFDIALESSTKITVATIIVVKNARGCLLSGTTSIGLGLLHFTVHNVKDQPEAQPLLHQTPKNVSQVPARLQPLIQQYDELFHGVGKLTDVQVKLHINPEVKPVVQPTRRIPFAIRDQVEKELKRLKDLDIIEEAQGATPWVSPIVAFPKPNNPENIRLCADMRLPNKAIERERHPQPTIDDLVTELNGACYFSKLDLNSAYHQLELDESSRYITTFTTHQGLFRYKRLNFGTSNASEVFQSTIQQVLSGIKGCKNISDDIIIYGKTVDEHDTALRQVFEVAKQRNL